MYNSYILYRVKFMRTKENPFGIKFSIVFDVFNYNFVGLMLTAFHIPIIKFKISRASVKLLTTRIINDFTKI